MTAAADLLGVSELRLFVPSPVFKRLLHERARKVLLRAANRVGKTRHSAWLVARHAIDNPGSSQRLVSPTNKHAQTVIGRYLAEFLDGHLDTSKSYYVDGRGWNGGRAMEVLLANGSVIELRNLEQKPDAHEGQALHRVVFDEPPTREHYSANRSRLVDHNGQLIIAATMVNRPVDWLRKLVEGDEDSPGPGRHLMDTGWVQYVAEFSRVNCPWYDEAAIIEWLQDAMSSPWDYAQRVKGAWEGVDVDRIFARFSEANVGEPPQGSLSCALWMDHGEVAGHQVGLLALYRGTEVWVLDEVVSEHATTPEEDAAAYAQMLRSNGIRLQQVDSAVGDVNTAGKARSGSAMNREIEAAFQRISNRRAPPFHIVTAGRKHKAREWGMRVVNHACRRLDLHIHPRCTHLLKTMRYWRGTAKGDDGELSHAADALRYGLMDILGDQAEYSRLHF